MGIVWANKYFIYISNVSLVFMIIPYIKILRYYFSEWVIVVCDFFKIKNSNKNVS